MKLALPIISLIPEPQQTLLSLLSLNVTEACVLFTLETVQPGGTEEADTAAVAMFSPCKLGNCFACSKQSAALSNAILQRVWPAVGGVQL
jgi:hypothetical protein